jgi:hypothetical protein
VTLKAGTYQLVLSDGDSNLQLETDRFALTRNGTQTVRIWRASSAEPASNRQTALAALRRRVEETCGTDPFASEVIELRQALLAYQRAHYADPEATEVARLMALLPWPADSLRREDIPENELRAAGGGDPTNAPTALVAAFGDSRLKHWVGVYSVAFAPNGTLHSAAARPRANGLRARSDGVLT